MMYMMTEQEHAQIVDALENSEGLVQNELEGYESLYGQYPTRAARIQSMREGLENHLAALAMLKAMQPVSQEPIAYFDFQGKGFRWAQSVSIGEVPMIVKVEPMPLYSAPTHIGNVDSLYTSQERVKKLEENVQMLLYALEEISSMAGKSARAIARAAMLAMEKQT